MNYGATYGAISLIIVIINALYKGFRQYYLSRPRHHLGDNLVHPVAKSSYQTNLVVSLL